MATDVAEEHTYASIDDVTDTPTNTPDETAAQTPTVSNGDPIYASPARVIAAMNRVAAAAIAEDIPVVDDGCIPAADDGYVPPADEADDAALLELSTDAYDVDIDDCQPLVTE